MASNRRWGQRDYAEAMRAVVDPTAVRELAREVLDIASDADVENSDRMRAVELLFIHTKGRPGTCSPAIDPLELPSVVDATSALDALGRVLQALCSGQICGDSAKLYSGLIGDAAKIALASKAVGLLANGGRPEFAFAADESLESQAAKLIEFLRSGELSDAVAAAGASAPAPPDPAL